MLLEFDVFEELDDVLEVLVEDPDAYGLDEEVWFWPEEGAPET